MLWIGPALGPLERACMNSVRRQGHRLVLWCYDEPMHVPDGVDLRDAAEILPRNRIIRHQSGSVSLFSNLFRYELQRRGLGTWLDCDVYLLKPLECSAPYLLSEYEPGAINAGVLRTPPDLPLLAPLIALFEERTVPPWLTPRARIAAHWRLRRNGRTDLSKMPWGSAGPAAITAMARRFGLDRWAVPAEVHSPVDWQDAGWIADPGIALEDVIAAETVSVHLWNERIKHFKDAPAGPGSFLSRLQEEGAI